MKVLQQRVLFDLETNDLTQTVVICTDAYENGIGGFNNYNFNYFSVTLPESKLDRSIAYNQLLAIIVGRMLVGHKKNNNFVCVSDNTNAVSVINNFKSKNIRIFGGRISCGHWN